jgi:hypothetical protein
MKCSIAPYDPFGFFVNSPGRSVPLGIRISKPEKTRDSGGVIPRDFSEWLRVAVCDGATFPEEASPSGVQHLTLVSVDTIPNHRMKAHSVAQAFAVSDTVRSQILVNLYGVAGWISQHRASRYSLVDEG